ncbi:CheR family methyltransferase [Pokkaliibacter plantistimulans]|nr:protein-glutamate O-methyltransferase CheR [Pokkaliibacter plantistimulans]
MATPLEQTDITSMLAKAQDKQREFAFSRSDFDRLRQMLYDAAGISLAEYKMDMVYSRLTRRLRDLKLSSFADYLSHLEAHQGELGNFINAMTTNLTAFFREPHHFDYLTNEYLPARQATGQQQIRVWSAGCSTGAEPYSIAIALRNHPDIDTRQWPISMIASDIDSNVLNVARAGVYDLPRIDGIDEALRKRWFLRGKGENAGMARVKPELQAMLDFRLINLTRPWQLNTRLELIFCRNVMIYFDPPTQCRILEGMADHLVEGGLLFVGHSESPTRVTDRFELIGKTIYRKR